LKRNTTTGIQRKTKNTRIVWIDQLLDHPFFGDISAKIEIEIDFEVMMGLADMAEEVVVEEEVATRTATHMITTADPITTKDLIIDIRHRSH